MEEKKMMLELTLSDLTYIHDAIGKQVKNGGMEFYEVMMISPVMQKIAKAINDLN